MKNNQALIIIAVALQIFMNLCMGQNEIQINAVKPLREIISGHLKMGNPGPSGKEIIINNQYMTIGGKPVIPVMGEIHYSRFSKAQWEDAILKMKANGINIIACYIFWIHHEEIEGQFDWTGNKDLRSFIRLCQKHDLWVYPRLGPWCHGEVRNGGTPDWVLTKKYLTDRSNHPAYQFYVDRLYREIAQQLQGLLYKENGPVIGVQFENEYRQGQQGEEHILWLKQTAIKYGIDVPMFTVTGWGNASVPQDEVIPLWGGYPAEPWATHIDKITENLNYTFEAPMNDENIGNESVKRNRSYIQDYSRYPYFTCELGIGNQISYHRRPVISPVDGLAIATTRTGSGSNLPGYYVFAGGLNPVGIYTTMEENRDETGYWNEYPDISYDFQAAIRETGELSPSYHQVKKLHYFLNEFGSVLAPMIPVITPGQNSKEHLQFAMRVKGNSGFIFGLNYYRGVIKPVQKGIRFNIQLPDETLIFPSKPVNIPDSCIFIWPVNLSLDDLMLKYATVQPLCKIEKQDCTDWIFIQTRGIDAELCFDEKTIGTVESTSGKTIHKEGGYIITNLTPGIEQSITIKSAGKKLHRIVVLSYAESGNIWLFKSNGRNLFFLSDANMYLKGNKLHIYSTSPEMNFTALSDIDDIQMEGKMMKAEPPGNYPKYSISLPEKMVMLKLEKEKLFDNAIWLKSSVNEMDSKNQLYHKIFIKEFNLGNPSEVKSAVMYLYTETECKININNSWLNQKVTGNNTNRLDFTGYVQKGANTLMLDFPFHKSHASFTAKLVVEYNNSDKIEIATNQSWLTTEQYLIPVPGTAIRGLQPPEIASSRPVNSNVSEPDYSNWYVSIPGDFLNGLNNLYLHIDYIGDRGKCRFGHRLVSDNYNNGTHWPIALKNLGIQAENRQLQIELYPLKPDYKIYFEKAPVKEDIGKTEIRRIKVIQEYAVDISLAFE